MLFYFLPQLIGIAMLGIGIWARLERDNFSLKDFHSMLDFFTEISILFVLLGCLIFMLGFCGCLGALRENTCLIKFVSYQNKYFVQMF